MKREIIEAMCDGLNDIGSMAAAAIDLRRILDAAGVDDTAELLRIVRKLRNTQPEFADGKPIFVGDEAWLPGYKYPGYIEYIMDGMVAVNDMAEWPADDCDTILEYTVRHPSTLYSTRAAAEQARKEGE